MAEIQDGSYTYGGIQTIQGAFKHRGHPYIWVVSKHGGIQIIQGVSKHMEASKHTGCIHTYGGNQMYGGMWIPLSVT